VKKCRFNSPDYISLYFDRALDKAEEKEFSEHLLTCKQCMTTLLELQKDLFLMNNVQMERVPARYLQRKAVFRLVKSGIELVKNLPGQNSFTPLVLDHAGAEDKCYSIEKDNVTIEIKGEGGEEFNIVIHEVAGRKVTLYMGGRIVEARSNKEQESLVIHNLTRGVYSLEVDGLERIQFEVE